MSRVIVCEGDSLVNRYNELARLGAWLETQLEYPFTTHDCAVNGTTMTQMVGTSRTNIVDAFARPTDIPHTYAYLCGGSNSAAHEVPIKTPAQVYAQLTSWVTGRKAAGFTAIVDTVPMRIATEVSDDDGSNCNAWYASFNALVLANTAGADVVVDGAAALAASVAAAGEVPGGSTTHYIDDAHLTAHGYNVKYAPLVAAINARTRAQMGTHAAAFRTAAINHIRNKATHTAAATLYCHAYNASGVCVSDAPASNANNKTTWSTAAGRAVTSLVPFSFADPIGDWGTVTEIRITDSVTPGSGLEYGRQTLATPRAINTSAGNLNIPAGSITIAFAGLSGFTDTVVHEWMDLAFGGTANTPRATVYGTYIAGDPANGGTETSATRTAITQATTWNTASNGLATTAAAISLADEADATYYAEYSASSGGTRLFAALLPGVPSGGVIPAGVLRTSLT